MSPRSFVMLIAATLLVAGLGVLTWPATAADGTDCSSAAATDAGHELGAALGGRVLTGETRVEQCDDTITTRRLIGWPMLALGAVALLGTAVVRTPANRPQGTTAQGAIDD